MRIIRSFLCQESDPISARALKKQDKVRREWVAGNAVWSREVRMKIEEASRRLSKPMIKLHEY